MRVCRVKREVMRKSINSLPCLSHWRHMSAARSAYFGNDFRRRCLASSSLLPLSQSKLPNGIRVASLNSPGACIAGGLYVELRGNSRLPPPPGVTASRYLLEKLSFKATQNLTEAKMHAKLDELVGSVQAHSTRESILYAGTVVPLHLKELLELLREASMAPLVTEKDLRQITAVVEYELEEMKNKPDELLPELAHGPAFYADFATKGADDAVFMDYNSILGVKYDLEQNIKSVDTVMEYWRRNFTTRNMLVVGTGMAHGELHNAAVDTFGSIEDSHAQASPRDDQDHLLRYSGGAQFIENEDIPLVHMLIGFQGAPISSDRSFALAILQMLMGGGNSFSAGGPGKGMYSRLYTQVLNRYHWIDSCKFFNHGYHSTGLFGIHGSAVPSHARDLVDVLLSQLHGMTVPLTNIEVVRAKNQVKSAVLMGLESRMTELEDLADQVSHLERYMSPGEICKRIDAVSAEELQTIARQLLDSRPTVVAYGPLHRTPPYDMILKWHHSRLASK